MNQNFYTTLGVRKAVGLFLALPLFSLFLLMLNSASAQCPTGVSCEFLKKTGSVTSAKGAEISAFDPASKRVFSVAGTVIEYHNLSNTGALSFGGELQPGFTVPTGQVALPNSVATSGGIVAASFTVATQLGPNSFIHHPGKITFYNAATGAVLNVVTVGSLPDMIVFTPNGKKLLTANEGEPSSYNQPNSVDPEGSVSIIDISNGVANASVQTATFNSFNGSVNALRTSGVRIYGPNATVAKDLEPEYIAISPDGSTAWVTLQENNAIAVVNIATATVTEIKPLGLKDHSKPTVLGLKTFELNNLPSIGTTAGGQSITLGGFSGLTYEGIAANGNLKFITHTDRGPNGEPTAGVRPFALPNFAPEIVRFEANRTTGQVAITQRIQLKKSNGQLLTGLPNINLPGATESTPYNDERGVNLFGNPTGVDPLGADLEGIVKAQDGSFYMVDEYRPALYHFDASGVMIKRYVPEGTAAAAGMPAGTYGEEKLPAVLAQRRQNRGFEAIAFHNGLLYLFVQSSIRNPSTATNGTLNNWKYTRVVEFNPATASTTKQFLYVMDNAAPLSATDTRADKIGDAVASGNGEFLVLERDDDANDSDPIADIQKKIYRFSLDGATNINTLPTIINGKTIEQMTLAELTANGIAPLTKYLHIDLATNYNMTEKPEGLTLVDCNTIALINDNDFGVGGLSFNATTGTFNNYPSATAEKPLLGLLSVRNNGLDASDRDLTSSSGRINIKHWPVFGMYQPDAIASYSANGQTYYITANEGDARADYPGFSEEVRAGSGTYVLDPFKFPNAAVLKNNANLGRLNVTNASGDIDADGKFDRIQAYGARSFSIWNANGELVFDSGDELEQLTAVLAPTLFNSDGTAGSFDTRSDNKGPEIEGVAIGIINGVPYAFVGLERTGDLFVFDVSNPAKPIFKQYINNPEDIAVEGVLFVPASQSPTGKPLVITSAEVSRTIAVFEANVPAPCTLKATPNSTVFTGGIPTNIYLGYGPQSVTLNTTTPASNTETYQWTGNGTLSNYNLPSTVFAPTAAGSYEFTLTVTNQCGVSTTCSITICVLDIRVPGKSGKVYICHAPPGNPDNAKTHSISINAVAEHLQNHASDKLGKCGEEPCGTNATKSLQIVDEDDSSIDVLASIYPNPSENIFTVQVKSLKQGAVVVRIINAQGKIMNILRGFPGTYTIGQNLPAGMYLVEVVQGSKKQMIKVIKQ